MKKDLFLFLIIISLLGIAYGFVLYSQELQSTTDEEVSEQIEQNTEAETIEVLQPRLQYIHPIQDVKIDLNLPLNVVLLGDSMMLEGLGPVLEKSISDIDNLGVSRFGKYASGLNRIDYYDWYTATKQYLESQQAEVYMVMFGANDGQDIYDYDTDEKYVLYTTEWEETYRNRINGYLSLFPKDTKVYWIGHPSGDGSYANIIELMNRLYKEEVLSYPNVEFVDNSDLFIRDGVYQPRISNSIGVIKQVRLDHVHLTAHGAEIVTENIIKELFVDINNE